MAPSFSSDWEILTHFVVFLVLEQPLWICFWASVSPCRLVEEGRSLVKGLEQDHTSGKQDFGLAGLDSDHSTLLHWVPPARGVSEESWLAWLEWDLPRVQFPSLAELVGWQKRESVFMDNLQDPLILLLTAGHGGVC